MRILFLSDNFPPEVNAPASRTYEHCREWVKAGHQVTVITCAPNFPTGRVFEGYRNRLWGSETIDGIRVIRVWSYITANEGFLRRTLDYVSYAAAAVLAAPWAGKVDIVVATSPQFFTACAGYIVGLLRRRPFVFELRDLWPDSIRAVGAMHDGVLLRWLEKLELFLYRRAAAVVCVTRAFRDNLVARGVESRKIFVITNGADLSRFKPMQRDEALVEELGLSNAFVAGYVGTHGMAHALETLLDAAFILQSAPDAPPIRFLLLGNGAGKAALVARALDMGLENVVFLDSVPKAEVPRYWSMLDVSIIHLRRSELFTTVIPSKLFECMAMGLPVLHGVAGESAEIVRVEGVGEVFESEDAGGLVARLLALARDPAARRRLAERGPPAARRYDRTALAGEMLAVLETVAVRR